MALRRDIEVTVGSDGKVVVSGSARVAVLRQGEVPWRPPVAATAAEPDAGDGRAPFPGLAPFEPEDAPFFFGRKAEIERLWRRLRDLLRPAGAATDGDSGAEAAAPVAGAARLVAVVGPAASGKTSLVRAGLIAELARWPLPQWTAPQVILLRSRTSPLADLATGLHRLITSQGGGAGVSAEDLARQLRLPDQKGRYDKLAALVASMADRVSAPLILVVDPAEAVYGSGPDPDERFAFADNLFRAAADPNGALAVVLVLRSESMEALAVHPETSQALSREALLLPALTPEGLREVVRRPAKAADEPIDAATEDLLVRECQGLGPCLVPLQLMLSRIWSGLAGDQRPMETYLRLGGVRNAVNWQCEHIFRALDDHEQELAREAFVALAETGEIVLQDAVGGSSETGRTHGSALLEVMRRFAAPGSGPLALEAEGGRTTARLRYEEIAVHWRRLRDWRLALPAEAEATEDASPEAPAKAEDRGGEAPTQRDPAQPDPSPPVSSPDEPSEPATGSAEPLHLTQPIQTPADPAQPPGAKRRSAVITVLAVCLIGALALAGLVEHRRQELAGGKLAAEQKLDLALRSQSRVLAALAVEQAELGDSEVAMLLALEALPKAPLRPERPFVLEAEGALYRALLSHRELAVLSGHAARVDRAAFSPDGTRIVTASADGAARLWNAANGRSLALLGDHESAVKHAAFSPDGRLVVTASASPEVRLWSVDEGQAVHVLNGHRAWVNHVAFDAQGERLISASVDRTARIWDVASGRALRVLEGHEAWVTHAVFSPDGTRALTASADRTARLWRLDGKTAPVVLSGHRDSVDFAGFSPDGTQIVTASADGTARLWDGESGAPLGVLDGHGAGVSYAAFAPSGDTVVTASVDGTARLWDARDGRETGGLLGHASWVTHAAFSPDGARAATASADGTARIWSVEQGRQIAVLAGHGAWVAHAAFSPDGSRLVTAHRDGTARLWDALAGRETKVLSDHQDWISDVAFSPDGALVASSSRDGTVRLWQRQDGSLQTVLARHDGWINRVAFSPTGERIVTASGDATARLWDTASGEVVAVISGHAGWINHAAFDADGGRLITTSVDGTAQLWDAVTGSNLVRLAGHEAWVNHAAFSPDGTRIVTASGDGTARVWDATTGAQLLLLAGHKDWVNVARFSPDGGAIVTASGDGTARLWSAVDGVLLATLSGHEEWVGDAAFSPDGRLVVTASADGTARLWSVPDGRERAVLAGHSLGINQAVFSPDGARVVTASGDGTARLWDVASGREVIAVASHDAGVNRVALSVDGRWLATASADGTAQVIPLYSTRELIERGQSLVTRTLTPEERARFFLDPDR